MAVKDLKALPKVLLHDHLDGSLRIDTILELAEEVGYRNLPATTPGGLADWFDQRDSESLDVYLASFAHTKALLQTPEALARVAYESVVDLAADGVVHAEIRFAPSHHCRKGMRLPDVVESVLAGLAAGQAETQISVGAILVAMRTRHDSADIANLAIAQRDAGVVGFDLAGPERGYPPGEFVAACELVSAAGLSLTIHAGEDAGPDYMMAAVETCGAQRIGHGVGIAEDCVWANGEVVELGDIARLVHDQRIPLEMCVTSNLNTKGWTLDEHPIGALYRAGFAITVNTDNRLMSRTTMTKEFGKIVDVHGFDVADLLTATEHSINAAFAPQSTRESILSTVIRPAYQAAAAAG